jgi:hypothetical protein
MKQITIDLVTEAYIKTRDEISELNKQIDKMKAVQGKREQWMLAFLDSQKMNQAKSGFGTVFEVKKESVVAGDWDATLSWIRETEQWEYLNHAVNKSAVLSYMGENRENPPPPGVNYSAIRTVQVRKA